MQFYVYRLVDPRNAECFYIGKGKGRRIDEHERETARGVSSPKCNRIKEITVAGLKVIKEKIGLFTEEKAAYAFERELIAADEGSLTNRGRVTAIDAPIDMSLCRGLAILIRMKHGLLVPIDDPAKPWRSAVSRVAFKRKEELIGAFLKLYPFDKWRDALVPFGVELVRGS